MSEIQEQVKKIVVDHLGIDESKVLPEAKFIDDLGADSLDTVELVMAFEEKFNRLYTKQKIDFLTKFYEKGSCYWYWITYSSRY